MSQINWEIKRFRELSTDELYDCLKLRVDIFVVEQSCAYPDLDDKDRHADTLHLMGISENDGIVAYLRILPPGVSFPQASIGRVAVSSQYRNKGASREMVGRAIQQIHEQWPGSGIKIGAQVYLEKFYASLGFAQDSAPYLEDGIPHVDMVKK